VKANAERTAQKVRLNKYLADCGVCARRKADDLIRAGHVTVDGRRASVGESIDPDRSSVLVRGKPVARAKQHTTLVLHKPRGVVTTMSDDRGRRTIVEFLPASRRLFPVGRLDADTTGILLCTTDGHLARILTHPSFGVEKRYRVRASGELSEADKKSLGAMSVQRLPDGTQSFDIVLREGKNRQVRRMCAQRGLRVLDLRRIRFGPVHIGDLAPGKTRGLTTAERSALERIPSAAAALPEKPAAT
jgi:23S rRNA pseudouridine2605 synthase